jgi:radical SAM-linked protein
MKLRAVYEKGDRVRFLGHLDVARCIQLSVFRAKWPVEMSQGFSPRPKISVYAPLPVGVSGEEEYFDAVLGGCPDLALLARTLSAALPEGFVLHEVYPAPLREEPFEESIKASSYSVDVKGVKPDRVKKALDEFRDASQVLFEVERPKGSRVYDLRPFVRSLGEPFEAEGNRVVLDMEIAHEKGRTVRPQWVLSSLSRYGLDLDAREAIFNRRKIIFG